jgi:hypothetical protein
LQVGSILRDFGLDVKAFDEPVNEHGVPLPKQPDAAASTTAPIAAAPGTVAQTQDEKAAADATKAPAITGEAVEPWIAAMEKDAANTARLDAHGM